MIASQLVHLVGFLELDLGGPDAVQSVFFHKGLGGFSDYQFAVLSKPGGNDDRHGAADAVAEQQEPGKAQRLPQGRKIDLRLFFDKASGRQPFTGGRLAETQSRGWRRSSTCTAGAPTPRENPARA